MTSFNIRIGVILPFLVILLLFPEYRAVIGIVALLIHESGHIIAIIALGYRIKGIAFIAGGLEIKTAAHPTKRSHKIIIALSGCMANTVWAVISMFIYRITANFDLYFEYFFFCSLVMACFNILPINGLDGGEALEQLLDRFFMPDTVYGICRKISLLFTFAIWVFACYILIVNGSNISLFLVCITLFLSNIGK